MIKDFDNRRITTSELATIIANRKKNHVNVFTTSMGSGTRHTFEKLLEKEKFLLARIRPFFSPKILIYLRLIGTVARIFSWIVKLTV